MLWRVEEMLSYLPNTRTVTLALQDIIQYGEVLVPLESTCRRVEKMLGYLLIVTMVVGTTEGGGETDRGSFTRPAASFSTLDSVTRGHCSILRV